MIIHTTLHLHVVTIRRISGAARLAGRSNTYIISRLLSNMANDNSAKPVPWERIRYQDRDERKSWHRLHVSLSPAEYELLLDLRKVYKMSGSRIIAYAVDKYFDSLVAASNEISDNYRLSCYVFSRFIMDGVICWAQYWGLPGKLHAIPELPVRVNNEIPLRGG